MHLRQPSHPCQPRVDGAREWSAASSVQMPIWVAARGKVDKNETCIVALLCIGDGTAMTHLRLRSPYSGRLLGCSQSHGSDVSR
jgi:hypothetical protein